MKYRPEVDGLRALAVLPVLFYHAGAPGFGGGFVGVDVFFVISGYLITGIILKDLKQGTFSLTYFYERRARRILPALYFVILFTLPMAWWSMMPSQLVDFSQSLVAVSVFAANVFFYLKSGYFEPAAELSPLLHTWSLAVEEQFYFVFPLFLMLGFRWFRRAILPVIIVLSVVSFVHAQHLLSTDPSQSFFLPFSRAWELMIGALLNFLPVRNESGKLRSECLSAMGILLILGSVVFLDANMPFPGLLAIPPTVGTALILYAASPSTLTGRILSNRFLVGIGLISYSTYLWHHPLFAFARLQSLHEPPLSLFLALSVLSIGLAYLSWRFVEQPFRKKGLLSRLQLVGISAVVIAPIMAIGLVGHVTNGFADIKYAQAGPEFKAFDERLLDVRRERAKIWNEIRDASQEPFSDDPQTRKVMVIGDSRAGDLIAALWLTRDLFPNTEFRYQRLDDLCFPALDRPNAPNLGVCGEEVKAFNERMQRDEPDTILVSCGWHLGDTKVIEALFRHIDPAKTVVFGTAAFNEINSQMYYLTRRGIPKAEWPAFFTQNVHNRSYEASMEVQSLTAQYPFRFVNSYEVFQVATDPETGDPVYDLIHADGDPIIVDQTHVSVVGARMMGRAIADNGWLSPIDQK